MEEDFTILIKQILNKCNVVFDNFNTLDGLVIPRDIFLKDEILKTLGEEIERMKKIFSSSNMTCLHKNAKDKQKFPILNLVRQILKSLKYNMEPIRKSAGYTKERKKIFVRYFKITKIRETQPK